MTEQTTEQLAKAGLPTSVKGWLNHKTFKTRLRATAASGIDSDQYLSVALLAINKQPKLLDCTPDSVIQCLLDLSAVGLRPDGRNAHLIPYKNNVKQGDGSWQEQLTCTVQLDYKGLVDLVVGSGILKGIPFAEVVYEKDDFDWAFGTGKFLKHRPALLPKEKRGNKKAVYSYVQFADGAEDFIVLSMDEIEAVRKSSRNSDKGPWKDNYDEMAKKTAFKRHTKWMKLTPKIATVIERDNKAETLETRVKKAKPVVPLFENDDETTDLPETTSTELPESSAPAEDSAGKAPSEEEKAPEQVDEGGTGPDAATNQQTEEKPTDADSQAKPRKSDTERRQVTLGKADLIKQIKAEMFEHAITNEELLAWCVKSKFADDGAKELKDISLPKIRMLHDKLADVVKQISDLKEE